MAATFGDARSELNDLAGLDLTDTERDRLLNEGIRALTCRSEWARRTAELGPTVVNRRPTTLQRICTGSSACRLTASR